MAFLTNTFLIEADIKQKKHIGKPVITANDTSTFIVSVQDNGVPMNMSKVTKAVLVNLCPDRQVFETVGVIQGDDKVVFDLPAEATAVAGTVRATVQLHGNDERVSTISFNYEVAKDLRMLHNPTAREKMLIEVALQDGPLYIEQAKVAAEKAEKVATENKTRWLPAVETVALRNSTYPNPAHGDTVRVTSEGHIYRSETGRGWILTDQYNPAAIDQVTAQLAEIAKGKINMIQFPKLAPETDDTGRIRRALGHLQSNDDLGILEFPQGEYKVSQTIVSEFALKNKIIDGLKATIVDKRTSLYTPMFHFARCENIAIRNFFIKSQYNFQAFGSTIPDLGPVFLFDWFNNTIEISNIFAENILGTPIQIASRQGYISKKIMMENIFTNHIIKTSIMFGALDTSHTPSIIKDVTINNVTAQYNGCYYNAEGKSTRNPNQHWTSGINFGEALDLLENAYFSNIHVSYASESGIHIEGRCSCVNVEFHNCSSYNNGQRSGAVYGYGFFVPKGCKVVNCLTGGNRLPVGITWATTTNLYPFEDIFYVDIFDNQYKEIKIKDSKIIDISQGNGKHEFLNVDENIKANNYIDSSTTYLRAPTNFYKIAKDTDVFKYYISQPSYTSLMKIEKDTLYKVKFSFRKKNVTSADILVRLSAVPQSKGVVTEVINNDLRGELVGKYLEFSRVVSTNKLGILSEAALGISTTDEIYKLSIEKAAAVTGKNLIENPMLLESLPPDFRYNTGGSVSDKFINNPDATKAYTITADNEGNWLTVNKFLTDSYSGNNRLYGQENHIQRHQKISITIAYKSDESIDTNIHYLFLGSTIYSPSKVSRGTVSTNIKDIGVTTKVATFILDVGSLPVDEKDYFMYSLCLITNGTYAAMPTIKFRVLNVSLIY